MKRLAPIFLLLAFVSLASCKPQPQAQPNKPSLGTSSCPVKNEYPGAVDKVLPGPGDKPAQGDWLVRLMPDEPATLNPITANDIPAEYVISLISESMLDLDLKTLELKPMLAESYEVSPDKLMFTFHLRKDVRWHDGKPFNADDVIYSFSRIMDPKVDAAPLRIYYSDCVEAKKIDDYTVSFRWSKPYFKALEMVGTMLVVPKHILNDGTDFNKHPFGRNPIGTGPYKFVSWDTGKSIVLASNPDYWGAKPYISRIAFKIITDENSALQVFEQGGLDLLALTPTQWIKQTSYPELLQRVNKIIYDYPQFGFIGWNMRRPPFDDKRVRTAMTMLLNREAILENIMYCMGRVVSGPFYINTPDYDQSIKPLPFDPEAAKKLLDQAGWIDRNKDGIREKNGKDFRFEFLIPSGSQDTEKIATIYKEDLRKVGIDMQIRQLEWAVFLKNVDDQAFDALIMGWAMDANTDLYQIWHSSLANVKGSSNSVGYKNPEVDKLIEEARQEFDRSKRAEINRKIHRIIAEDQPYTFLFNAKARIAVDKRFKNVVPYSIRPIFKYTEWFVPAGLQKYSDEKAAPTTAPAPVPGEVPAPAPAPAPASGGSENKNKINNVNER